MNARRTLNGKLLVRFAPGLEFTHVHAHRDVRLGLAAAAMAFDGGHIDRTIRRHSESFRASHAFTAARSVGQLGQRHIHFDDVEHELGLARTFRVDVPAGTNTTALLADLAAIEGVEMASPIHLVEGPAAASSQSASSFSTYDAWTMIGAHAALADEPGDSALIVGLVDSGASPAHPELLGRLRPGLNTVSTDDLAGDVELLSRVRPRGQDVTDDQGHGTAVAGILGANGLSIPPGLAGAAEILPIRALCGARMRGSTRVTALGNLADIDSGVKTAIDLGARVLNLSFGTPESALAPDDPVPHVSVVRYAAARGCVLVAASGNSGVDERYFPAALPGVITVGAVGPDRRRAPFSTGGPHVTLSAPGQELSVAALDGYARLSGTSFAAPLVAGACALLMARAWRRSTALAPEMVREILMKSASPLARGDARTTTASCGAGILDVKAALAAVDEACVADAA